MKKQVILIILAFAITLCINGCNTAVINESYSLSDRLDILDDYKKQIASTLETISEQRDEIQNPGTFRDIPYGYSRQDVIMLEPLQIIEEYDNAIDYDYVNIFGNDMLPTYWFNNNDLLYRGSYYSKSSDDLAAILNELLSELDKLYGDARETNYYDFNNKVIYLDGAKAAEQAVSSGAAYFYAWYSYDEIDVEVYIEVKQPDRQPVEYDVFVNYTDYTYYDYQ